MSSNVAKVAGGAIAALGGVKLFRWLEQLAQTENQVSAPTHNGMEPKAPSIPAMQECSDLCQLLYDEGMGYKVVTKNELHILTPLEGVYLTVVINKDTISNDLTIIITAPPTVQNILGHSQARCTTVQQTAAALVHIRAKVREKLEPSESATPESIATNRTYDA